MAGAKKEKIARAIGEEEIEGHFDLMCRAFDLDESLARAIYFADPFFDLTHKRVLAEPAPGTLFSCLTIVPSKIQVAGGAALPMAGIAGVGTPPELRGKGYASALLAATVEQIPDEFGYPLVGLVTDQPDFYRRFGWECCATIYDWSAPPRALPSYTEGKAVRVLMPGETAAHATEIHSLYDRARTGQVGTLLRDSRRWFCIEAFSRGRQVAVLAGKNGIEAYVAFEERDEDGARILIVQEMIAVSEGGRRALVGFLARQSPEGVVRGRTNATEFAAFHLDRFPGLQVQLVEGMMLRITDLDQCISAVAESGYCTPVLQKHPSGLTIRIENAKLSAGNKPVRLFPIVDNTRMPRLAMSPADELEGLWISADVGAFTQLFIGYRSATQLHSEGRLMASSPQALPVADHLFPSSDPLLATPDTF